MRHSSTCEWLVSWTHQNVISYRNFTRASDNFEGSSLSSTAKSLYNAKSVGQKEHGMKVAGKICRFLASGDQICRDQIPEARVIGAKP